MKEIICIVCPNGCLLKIDETTLKVDGAKCKRGEKFALEELSIPKRSVSTTLRCENFQMKMLPVKTSGDIPKDKVFECIRALKDVVIHDKVKMNDVIVENILNLNVNIIASCDLH